MNPEIAASYRSAEAVARSRARNFYYAFAVLPSEKRRAFCAVYSFMRYCDDISDGSGALDDKRRALEMWRAQLNAAVKGEFDGSPILPAFHDSVRRYSIPADYFHWIIDGAEMDLTISHYETFADLYRYCFNVASAVGLVCLQIFGYTEERARKLAEHCGIAFQLTNILRDIKEDAGLGRIYLPAEDLERFHYAPDDLRRGVFDARFQELMTFETDRASQYYTQARALLPLVHAPSRPALWAMMQIYERLLRKIVQRRFDVFGPAIRLSAAEKTAIALRALSMRFFHI
ncbi:MAG: phytoene/squalene synthase family protein [Acidobacteriia bacterium]|nr:phytoene/squalene synthase family protein [Terriglobia bacterium]